MMRMRRNRILGSTLAAAMVLSLAACGGSAQPAATTAAQTEQTTSAAETAAAAESSAAEAESSAAETTAAAESTAAAGETEKEAQHSGMKLEIPEEYKDLLITETFPDDESKPLFSVYEKASVEAAKANGYGEDSGLGWLFSISRVGEEEAKQMMCGDMSGMDLFARDAEGNYYVFEHPTDVRIEREGDVLSDENSPDWKQWSELNEWAATVQDTFVKDNEGLTAEKHGNSDVDIALARIAYEEDIFYTVSTTEYGPKAGEKVDPAPYLEKLRNGVTYNFEEGEAPDGEYVVLDFPEEQTRYDFFKAEGNYIREVNYGYFDYEMLFKAEFEDSSIKASDVMQEWYDALVKEGVPSVYSSSDGWMVRFGQDQIEASEQGKHAVQFIYKNDAEKPSMLEIRFVDKKQPQEVLGEVTENWGDQEKIRRFEGVMPGTKDMWAFWRDMTEADEESGLKKSAIAGEYNGGALLFDFTTYLTGDDAKDIPVSDCLAELLNSITYSNFEPQTMYDYVPGTYSAVTDGFVSAVTLFPDHTGRLSFQDDVDITWTSTHLLGEDGKELFEYSIEGDSLLLNFEGDWVSFEKETAELHSSIQRSIPSPEWVTELDAVKDENVRQLFIVAGLGEDKTTAYVSMHEKDWDGQWKQVLSTPGFVGKNGLCADADHKEGCGQTPIGTYHFNKAFGIAEDPGCMIPYTRVTGDDWWSGDDREGMHYNELVSLRMNPDLALDNSEHITDYEYEYQYCLNISFNEDGTPGRGSAIFLHCLGQKKPYTGGCVAIPENLMKLVMQKVEPDCVVMIDTAEKLGISF